jgi:hypothetical protein
MELTSFICMAYTCFQEELHFILDDIISFNVSSKRDRFQLHGVCKQRNNNVSLQGFLSSLRDFEIRRLAYQENFLSFDVFRLVKDKFTGLSLTLEIARNLKHSWVTETYGSYRCLGA